MMSASQIFTKAAWASRGRTESRNSNLKPMALSVRLRYIAPGGR
jgi:hypothetical protein